MAADAANIRQEVSDKAVRSVPSATMVDYQGLSDSERGVIVGAQRMKHNISEVAMKT